MSTMLVVYVEESVRSGHRQLELRAGDVVELRSTPGMWTIRQLTTHRIVLARGSSEMDVTMKQLGAELCVLHSRRYC